MITSPYQMARTKVDASAIAYESLTFANGEYLPQYNGVFAGIHVAANAAEGAITIVGIDGVAKTLTIGSGVWPFGGIKILASGTTISTAAVTILF